VGKDGGGGELHVELLELVLSSFISGTLICGLVWELKGGRDGVSLRQRRTIKGGVFVERICQGKMYAHYNDPQPNLPVAHKTKLRDAKNKLEKWKSERDFPARRKGRTIGLWDPVKNGQVRADPSDGMT